MYHYWSLYVFISVDDRLEDEDYDLIRENTGINVAKVSILCKLHVCTLCT